MTKMGYCYTTGKKVKGRWTFLKCDGRSNKCAQDGGVVPNISPLNPDQRCKNCVEYCTSWTIAKEAIETYYKDHPEELI